MGFIKDNMNTFEVYLTDLGKQRFFDGGFKDAVVYFSIIDGDSNYDFFKSEDFNPTVLSQQRIPMINHVDTYKTSLGNGEPDTDDFIRDVFTQTSLRGNLVDNQLYKRALFGIKHNAQRNYVMFEPDLSNEEIKILTYINVDA